VILKASATPHTAALFLKQGFVWHHVSTKSAKHSYVWRPDLHMAGAEEMKHNYNVITSCLERGLSMCWRLLGDYFFH